MLKNKKIKMIVSSILTLSPIIAGLLLWDKLPDKMAVHWGAGGNADGYSSPFLVVFILPIILLLLHLLCHFITSKDPKNIEQNKKASEIIYWIIPFTSIFSSFIIYSSALESNINLFSLLSIFLGLMFIFIGNYMPKTKQNSTLGIKIKYTLENEENWNATHRFCGKVWFFGGILVILTALLPKSFFPLLFIIMLPIVFAPLFYSIYYHKKQVKEGTATVSPIHISKELKGFKTGSIIAVIIIIVFITIVMFSGNISLSLGEKSFKVDATYWSELEVDYDAIDSIEYLDSFNRGIKTNGFNSAKLSLGIFENEDIGSYTIYTYNSCKQVILLKVDNKTLVINAKTPEETLKLFNELKSK